MTRPTSAAVARPAVIEASVLAGEVSPTNYELPENLTYDEWAQIGQTFQRILNAAMWWLGSWWLHGEHHYGERAAQAAPLGYKADTLTRAARVCERIPPEERDERLSFGHYVALARLETRPRGRIRDQAIAENWTVRDTERAVKRARDDGDVVEVPNPVIHEPVTVCAHCHEPWPCSTVSGPEEPTQLRVVDEDDTATAVVVFDPSISVDAIQAAAASISDFVEHHEAQDADDDHQTEERAR
jgi:HTH domain found in ParB protein